MNADRLRKLLKNVFFGRAPSQRPWRRQTRQLWLERLEDRLAPAVQLTYGGPGSVLGLTELVTSATPTVTVSEPVINVLKIDLGSAFFDASSAAAAPGLTYQNPGAPTTSHFATVSIGTADNVGTLVASLPGDTFDLRAIRNFQGGLGNITASAGVINVSGVSMSQTSAGNGAVTLVSAGALTVTANTTLDAGTGAIVLAADVNANGTGDANTAPLSIQSGAVVVSSDSANSAITLRGAAINIDTSARPAVIGAYRIVTSTPAATLTGLSTPRALAFDAGGNLFVPNENANTVSEFAPGGTTPTKTLTGLSEPFALAFDASGDLFVANLAANTVSEFAPGSTTPTKTLTGLNGPVALAFDASGNLFVANFFNNTVSEFAPGSTTPTKTLTGLSEPFALAFDASGNLFAANFAANTISEFIPGSTAPTATLTGLNGPVALAFDAVGNLFAVNLSGNTVSEFAPGSTTPTGILTGLTSPFALAFDASGNLFVANQGTTTVSEFAPGSVTAARTLTGLTNPQALAFDSSGNLFVANTGGTTVSEFTATAVSPAAGGVTIRTALSSQTMSLGGNASGANINLNAAEFGQIFARAGGTVTVGDTSQTGTITFQNATLATTALVDTVVLQSGTGTGQIVLDNSAGTALNGNSGSITLTAGTGGIVEKSTNTAGTADLATTGVLVSLQTSGPIGTSAHRIQFASNANPLQQNVFIASASLEPKAIYLAGLGNLTVRGIVTTKGLLDVTTPGALTVASPIFVGGAVNLTVTGADGTLTSTSSIQGTSATLTADRMVLDNGTINVGTGPGNVVTLQAFSANRLIHLGTQGDPAGSLNLDSAEINSITAAVLHIGSSSAGNLDVTAAIAPSHVATLLLKTGGGIIENGGSLKVSVLGLSAAMGIGSLGALSTQVSSLAFQNSTTGAVQIVNTGGMTVRSIGNLTSSFDTGGAISLSALQGGVTFAVTTISSGDLTATTTEGVNEVAGNPEEDIVVNSGVTVKSTTGAVTLSAADSLTEASGALIQSVSSAVTLNNRVGDTDQDGAFHLNGAVRGQTVTTTGTVLPVASLSFATQPKSLPAGTVFPPITVVCRDRFGKLVPGATVTIRVVGGAFLAGTLTLQSNAQGQVTFTNLSMGLPGTFQLQAVVGGVVADSAFFTISASSGTSGSRIRP